MTADPIIRHDPGSTTELSLEDQIARVRQQSATSEPYFEHEVLLADDEYVTSVWNMHTRKGGRIGFEDREDRFEIVSDCAGDGLGDEVVLRPEVVGDGTEVLLSGFGDASRAGLGQTIFANAVEGGGEECVFGLPRRFTRLFRGASLRLTRLHTCV